MSNEEFGAREIRVSPVGKPLDRIWDGQTQRLALEPSD